MHMKGLRQRRSLGVRLRRWAPHLLFVTGFILLCYAYGYGRLLWSRPQPHHIFRQCDCLGMTWNYAFTDANFLHPRMCNLHADHDTAGYTSAEFPLIYWGVGMLWRLIGQSEFAFRLIMLLLHIAGSYALYLLAWRITRSSFWGIWTSLLFFTSPATAYFAVSFLPEVPAFDLGLIGCWWFHRYFTERRRYQLLWALAFTSLALLVKVTAGFFFIALWGVLLLESLGVGRRRQAWRLFPEPGRIQPWFLAALVPVVLWYAYSQHYNDVHANPFTQTGLSPLWGLSTTELTHALHEACTIVLFELFSAPAWWMFLGCLLLLIHAARSLPWQVVAFHAMLLVGLALYLVGWTAALNDHDYYFICPQVILVAWVITVLWKYGRGERSIIRSPWLNAAAMLLLGWSVFYAAKDMALRTRNGAEIALADMPTFFTPEQREFWRTRVYWERASFLDLEPFTRSLGIKRSDKVLITPDQSWQVDLYLCGQTGWNDYTLLLNDSLSMARAVRLGARYLFITNTEWPERPYMRPFLTDPIGTHGEVTLFDLRHAPGSERP